MVGVVELAMRRVVAEVKVKVVFEVVVAVAVAMPAVIGGVWP